ncbi:hypothetical protein BD779DRAFT_1675630 [Infundibulicybe gibba]|nr:hypothetical protein BD779DRAFT_1675630 [Infundibulicybe gibba]
MANPTPFAAAFESCLQLHTFALKTYVYPGQHPENLRIANFNVPRQRLTTLRVVSPSIPAHEYLDVPHSAPATAFVDLEDNNVFLHALYLP